MARSITLFIHSSLNGVVTGDPAEDKTDFPAWTKPANLLDEASSRLLQLFETVDTVLLGHATYDDLSRTWPQMTSDAESTDVGSRLAAKINNSHKIVVTRDESADQLPWGRFPAAERLPGTEAETKIRALKATAGGGVVIIGSPTLVDHLTDADLIDEYQIVVHPVVVEVGEHLFSNLEKRLDLELLTVEPFKEGGVLLTYRVER